MRHIGSGSTYGHRQVVSKLTHRLTYSSQRLNPVFRGRLAGDTQQSKTKRGALLVQSALQRKNAWNKLLSRRPSGKQSKVEESVALEDAVGASGAEGNRPRGILLLNILVLLCGINWVVLKKSESLLDPSIFCNFRFLIASVLFWPQLRKVDKEICLAGIDIGFWAAIGYLAQAEGLLTTDASRASFLSALTVLVVPVLAGLSGRGIRTVTWLSSAAAFLGVGLLEGGVSSFCIGDFWQLVSAFAFGVQILRTEKYSRQLKPGSSLPLMAVVVATIAVMSLLLTASEHIPLVLNWARHPDQLTASMSWPTPGQALPVIWSALMSTDLVLLIEVLALHDVSSVDASIIYTLEPVLGAFFSYFLLGERWGNLGWLGAMLIVGSSLATQLYETLPHKAKELKR